VQVTLTKDLEKFIARKVQAGGYANAGKVVRDALRRFARLNATGRYERRAERHKGSLWAP